jgi:hypothetical protein
MADLKELLGEELGTQVQGILEEKKVNFIVDDKEKPSYIPKQRFDEVIGSKNELKATVGTLSGELENLKKLAKGNGELEAKIEELQKNRTESEEKYNKSLIDNAVKFEAVHNKALDPADLAKFLDYSTLELDEAGNVKGLSEQITNLKENKGYLFEISKQTNNNSPTNPVNVVQVKNLDEQHQQAMKDGNKSQAVALKLKMFNM